MTFTDQDKDHLFSLLEHMLRVNTLVAKKYGDMLHFNDDDKKVINEAEDYLKK